MQTLSETGKSGSATRSALLGWLLVSAMHVTILTAGFVWPAPSYSAYYNRQADAFLHGQTHLILKPPAGLLALPDPYDPDANRPYRKGIGIHDSVLFEGKFYLYWGPVPALLLVPIKACGLHGIIGDEWLVAAFMLGSTLLVSLILRNLWLRHFSQRPARDILLGIVLYGLATPATFFLARAAVYEAAIAGGQFFLVLAIWLLTSAPSYSGERVGMRGWFFAGLALAAAVGCRASLAIAVVGITLFAAIQLLRYAEWKKLAMFSAPLIAGAIALAAYNVARFGSVTEFGQKYQLTGANYRTTPALFSLANAAPSTWSYLLRPFNVGPGFPFVQGQGGEDTFPAWINRPAYYESKEAIVGLLISTPLFLLAVIPIAQWLGRRVKGPAIPLLLISGALAFAPILLAVGSTQRYQMDLWPCLAVLTSLGLWYAMDRGTVLLRGIAVTMLIWTVGLGLLMGASGYYEHLKTWNPTLYRDLGGL